MRLDDIILLLDRDIKKYRETLFAEIKSEEPFLNQINDHILLNNGKELRGLLALLAARICGKPTTLSYNVAAVGQILHNATLIHDDVVDEAVTRRGNLTVGAKYSAAAAVLIGDFWLSRALNLLNKELKKEVNDAFSLAISKMSEGELIQLQKANTLNTTEKDYYKIIEYKTSALFVACMECGAISVGADLVKVEQLKKYAAHLGNAFQMKDDILDYTPSLNTGKPSGLDIKEKKITLPLLCAFNNCPDKELQIRELIRVGEIEKISTEVLNFVKEYNGVATAETILKQEGGKAKEALSIFPETPEKEALIFFADYVCNREI